MQLKFKAIAAFLRTSGSLLLHPHLFINFVTFALQLDWCNGFLHLLHAGSLQLAWFPQFPQYKFSCSHILNQKLHESFVCIFVLKMDFLTYLLHDEPYLVMVTVAFVTCHGMSLRNKTKRTDSVEWERQ